MRFPVWGEGRVGARASDFVLVACAAQAALDVEGRCIALTAAVGGATDAQRALRSRRGAAGLAPADGGTLLVYTGSGEVGGLIAGVGQRVLRGSVLRELAGD